MLNIGCHLSASKGYMHMGEEAKSINANTFQFFTRNPRGGKAKDIDEQDVNSFLEFMKENGIEIMPINYKGVPAVKKKIDGHGGIDVYMLDKAEPFEDGYVYQKPCDTLGRDVRVWLIGEKIIASILRSSDTDFRSNFCLGGKASEYTLIDDDRALVYKIADLLDYDYIGIDFIFNNGRLVFNEIEDTVGARMIYSLTDIDIISLYCDYIKEELDL